MWWVKVSRASLHNFDYVKQKDIRVWDWGWVQRSWEVIPYILWPVKERRLEDVKEINPPTNCPVCDSIVSRTPWEVACLCSNLNCKAQIKERLIYFVWKECMDIDWFWEQIIDILVETWLIKNIIDIYQLSQPENRIKLSSLPLMWSKRISELLFKIDKSKNNFLRQILNWLWIKFLWKKTSQILAQEIQKNNKEWKVDYNLIIKYLTNEEFLLQINWIWEKLIESLKIFLTNEENINLLKKLSELWINFDNFVSQDNTTTLLNNENKSFSISGKFDFSRNKIIEILEKHWFTYHDQPTKNTKFIVIWEWWWNKLVKAQKYNIEVLNWINELFKKFEYIKTDFETIIEESNKKEYKSKSLF
jgi:DNA ligase (NAD+)